MAVVSQQTGYAIMDERWKTNDVVPRGHDKPARIGEEVPVISVNASNQDKGTIRKVVAFSKELTKEEIIQNTTLQTPQVPKVSRKTSPVIENGYHEFIGRRQLN